MERKLVNTEKSDGEFHIAVFDKIDEDLKFPQALPAGTKSLTIDFGEVTYMNSMGLRNWIRWINSMTCDYPDVKLRLDRVTLAFLRTLEVIRDALPTTATVRSFQYDVFCNTCEGQQSVLIQNLKGVTLPDLTCEKCKTIMEPELRAETYEPVLQQGMT